MVHQSCCCPLGEYYQTLAKAQVDCFANGKSTHWQLCLVFLSRAGQTAQTGYTVPWLAPAPTVWLSTTTTDSSQVAKNLATSTQIGVLFVILRSLGKAWLTLLCFLVFGTLWQLLPQADLLCPMYGKIWQPQPGHLNLLFYLVWPLCINPLAVLETSSRKLLRPCMPLSKNCSANSLYFIS